MAALLGEITGDWLRERQNGRKEDQAQQAAIRRAAPAIGSTSSGDTLLASQVSQGMKQNLKERYAREGPSRYRVLLAAVSRSDSARVGDSYP